MPVLNLYVSDEINKLIRKRAKAEKKSISSLAEELLRSQLVKKGWSKEFLDAFGSMPDFPDVEDLPPQKREGL